MKKDWIKQLFLNPPSEEDAKTFLGKAAYESIKRHTEFTKTLNYENFFELPDDLKDYAELGPHDSFIIKENFGKALELLEKRFINNEMSKAQRSVYKNMTYFKRYSGSPIKLSDHIDSCKCDKMKDVDLSKFTPPGKLMKEAKEKGTQISFGRGCGKSHMLLGLDPSGYTEEQEENEKS